MKFVANRINNIHLRDLLPTLSEDLQVDDVKAAIAYGSSSSNEIEDLIGNTVSNKLRLDLWMRYDHTVPVAVPFLRRLFKHQKDNIFTNFVPDCFHSKVIWWKGYGAYIGSANHTDRGWLTNIEAGIFIEEDELFSSGMSDQLEAFFDYLESLENTIPISGEYIEEMDQLNELNKEAFDKSKKFRQHSFWEGPAFIKKQDSFNRRKERFQKEWLSTLGILQDIQDQINEHRPVWISEDVPAAWQVDQFLHAYYYQRVGDAQLKPYEDYYKKHKANPSAILRVQLSWWKNTELAPTFEDRTLYEDAPVIRELLSKEKVLSLNEKEVENLFRKTHATKDHIIKIPLSVLGRPDLDSMSRDERIPLFANLMFKVKNKKGWGIREVLHYVLYEGAESQLWERLYHAGRDSEYSLPRYGLNSIAEVTGWARPDVVPPRNGRTSKALKALGYSVKIY